MPNLCNYLSPISVYIKYTQIHFSDINLPFHQYLFNKSSKSPPPTYSITIYNVYSF